MQQNYNHKKPGTSSDNDPIKAQPRSLRKTRAAEAIQAGIILRLSEALGINPDRIDIRVPLTSYGLDSIVAFNLTGELADWLAVELPATAFWDYPTIETLSHHLSEICDGRDSAATLHNEIIRLAEEIEGLSKDKTRDEVADHHQQNGRK